MGKDVTDKSDGTAEHEEKPEVQSVREENRRLFELVDRLIATQESEQRHRKIIESELQQMKFALVKKSSDAENDATESPDASELGKNFEQLLEKFGAGLEEKLLARLDDVEDGLRAPAIDPVAAGARDPRANEELVSTIWKMIAPLGGELERLSSTMQDIGQQVDQAKAESPLATTEITQELKALSEEVKQLRGEGSAVQQDSGETSKVLEGLSDRLDEVGQSLKDLAARQNDAQVQTETRLRDLVESHMERLNRQWAGQIAAFQRSVDDLLLDRAPHSKLVAQDLSDIDSEITASDNGESSDAQDTTPNVVTGDFGSSQKVETSAASDSKEPEAGSGGMSPDLEREMRAMDAGNEASLKSIDVKEALSEGLGADVSSIAAEGPNTEDALLTKPADWCIGKEAEEEAILLSHPIVADGDEKDTLAEPEAESSKQAEQANETAAATSGRREIDLRAFKDLRLSSEPVDGEDSTAKLPTGERAPSYENAPAEASLTRFVRLIRARKRSSPS